MWATSFLVQGTVVRALLQHCVPAMPRDLSASLAMILQTVKSALNFQVFTGLWAWPRAQPCGRKRVDAHR
eukprot:3473624-Amphidinium_carterae.2